MWPYIVLTFVRTQNNHKAVIEMMALWLFWVRTVRATGKIVGYRSRTEADATGKLCV